MEVANRKFVKTITAFGEVFFCKNPKNCFITCLLYTSDAADDTPQERIRSILQTPRHAMSFFCLPISPEYGRSARYRAGCFYLFLGTTGAFQFHPHNQSFLLSCHIQPLSQSSQTRRCEKQVCRKTAAGNAKRRVHPGKYYPGRSFSHRPPKSERINT